MSKSVNRVTLLGHLGRDPDIRTMQSGDKLANLSIATSEKWKDKNTNTKHERTVWHRVVIFNQGLVHIAEQYLQTGSKVYLEGQLENRKWTDGEGIDRYTTEVVLRSRSDLVMLDGKSSDELGDDDPDATDQEATDEAACLD